MKPIVAYPELEFSRDRLQDQHAERKGSSLRNDLLPRFIELYAKTLGRQRATRRFQTPPKQRDSIEADPAHVETRLDSQRSL